MQDNNRLSYRYTIHGGGSFPVNGSNRIHFSAHYMKQNQAVETTMGGSLRLYAERYGKMLPPFFTWAPGSV